MSKPMTLNVRDLIRRDKERVEADSFARLKAELTRAFAAPDSSYQTLDAETVIARNRRDGYMPGTGSGGSSAGRNLYLHPLHLGRSAG